MSDIDIFFSYCKKDFECAQTFVTGLEDYGLRVWWDRLIIDDRQNAIHNEIEEAIDSATYVVVLWSKNSLESNWVLDETKKASTKKKLVQLLMPKVSIDDLKLGYPKEYIITLPDPLSPQEDIRVLINNIVALSNNIAKEYSRDTDKYEHSSFDRLELKDFERRYINPAKILELKNIEDCFKEHQHDIIVTIGNMQKENTDELLEHMRIDEKEKYSSFLPSVKSKPFHRIKIETTPGWVSRELFNTSTRFEHYKQHADYPAKNPACPQSGNSSESEGSDETNHPDASEKEHNLITNSQDPIGSENLVKVRNWIYIVRDPVRPFETQIGVTRAMRPNASPGIIHADITLEKLKGLYLIALADDSWKWLRMSLAEILSEPDCIEYIHEMEKYLESKQMEIDEKQDNRRRKPQHIEKLAARNPSAPTEIQKLECILCNSDFKSKREVYCDAKAYLFPNDYPFGPFFHYILAVKEPVHSWAEMKYEHYLAMNRLLRLFFKNKKDDFQNIDMEVGLNSTTRHLVLGKETHSSAGASIPHVHKQIWGMMPHSINIGDHLSEICDIYDKKKVDYLGKYLKSLRKIHCIIWEDSNIALFVPFGQTSKHELQAIVKRRENEKNGNGHGEEKSKPDPYQRRFIDLNEEEIKSLSLAEYLATQLFRAWGISSFNEVMISKRINTKEKRAGEEIKTPSTFRLIFCFITREVDIAVSELSLLYVVDNHPKDTVKQVIGYRNIVQDRIEKDDPDLFNSLKNNSKGLLFNPIPRPSDCPEYQAQ